MGLRLIYGRAGSGKSQYCFNKIKENIDTNSKIYIITPEQFSFTAEQKLLETLNKNAVINAEVITFNRMADRIFTEVGRSKYCTFNKSTERQCLYIAY